MWTLAKSTARDRLMEAQEIQKQYYDRKVKAAKTYDVGTKVMIKVDEDIPGKFNMRWKGPYTILEKKSEVNYKLLTPKGKEYVTHVDRMKKCNSEKQTDNIEKAASEATGTRVSETLTADKNLTVVESRTRAPVDNNPNNRIQTNENQNQKAATAAATGAEEMTVASTKATAKSNARVTATKNPPPVKENAAQKSKGDSTAAATRAKEMTLASSNAKEKSDARVAATKNPQPIIGNEAQESKGDSAATATVTQARVTASKTAVTNAGTKVAAPRRILTREVIFPRKYKDFVVQTRRN
jgi:hypothetical protein